MKLKNLRRIELIVRFSEESESNTDLNPQQKMILQHKLKALEMIDRARDALDNKAMKLLGASSIVIAIVSILLEPQFGTLTRCSLQFILTVFTFVALLIMILLLLLSIGPKGYEIPGSQSWDELYDKYIIKSVNESFEQIMSDYISMIDSLGKANKSKNVILWISSVLFLFQIISLIIILFISFS